MPNPIKYSTSSETLALKKGNFYIGTGDVGKGPSDTTGYYNGVSPSSGGYVIYLYKSGAPGNLSYHNAPTDAELISFTNSLAGQSYTGVNQCLVYFASQTDKVVLNRDYEGIVTDGLVLNLDAGFTPSYPRSGTTWYDVLGSNNGTLTNGPTFDSGSGGSIVFDGVDDYVTIPNSVSLTSSVTVLFWINKSFTNYYFHMNSRRNSSTDPTQTGIGSTTPVSSNGWCQVGYLWDGNTSYFVFNGEIINSNSGGKFAYDNSSAIVIFSANNNGYFAGNDAPLTNLSLQNSTTSTPSGFQWVDRNYKVLGILNSQQNRRPFNGNMSSVLFYNRALTSSEILQNYNAQKGRFGL